jgi:RHS repeat-associated protein
VSTTSYGVPIGIPGADTDSDFDCDSTDVTQIQTWIDASAYDIRGDVDLDGTIDAGDKNIAQNYLLGTTLGWKSLSAVGAKTGLAGYHYSNASGLHFSRARNLRSHLGHWDSRDPLIYLDSASLYEYVQSRPVSQRDALGTLSSSVCSEACWPNCCDSFHDEVQGRGGSAATVCCYGQVTICTYPDLVTDEGSPYPDTPGGDAAGRIADKCLHVHEQAHADNSWCRPDQTSVTSHTIDPSVPEEDNGQRDELKCLQGESCETVSGPDRDECLEIKKRREDDICKTLRDPSLCNRRKQ